MGRSQPRTERDIVWVFGWVCTCISVAPLQPSLFPPRLPLPPLLQCSQPWGSLQPAAPYSTETQPPYKSHLPIYLTCSSTRTPSIRPRGARISKHSNSLGVAISTGLELHSQIPKSLQSIVPQHYKAHAHMEEETVWWIIAFPTLQFGVSLLKRHILKS